MSTSNGASPVSQRVTFGEVRTMARWLDTFTVDELADALRVNVQVADDFVIALDSHGMLTDEPDWIDGPEGPEPLYQMEPLPDTHYPRNKYLPPEVQAVLETGGFMLYDLRGRPVRITNKGEKGRVMSTPGARQKQKLRDLAYARHQEALKQRQEKDRKKFIARTQYKDLSEV